MNRKKLIVLTSTFPRWPNDTLPPFVYELCRRLVPEFDIHILTPHYPGALQNEEMEGMKIHRFRYFLQHFERLAGSEGILPTLRRNRLYYLLVPFFLMGELLSLLKLVRKIKADAVHAHWLIPQGLVAAVVKKITGTPYLVTAHGGDVFGVQNGLMRFCKKMALENADRITVVSNIMKKVVLRMAPSSVDPIVLPMGVDSTRFECNENDDWVRLQHNVPGPLLLFVGRLTEKKGVRYLLKAMPSIINEIPDVKLLVIGGGEDEESLRDLSISLNVKEHVKFTGAITNADLPAYYRAADIFIGPSIKAEGGDTEGFGLTFVEAGMAGCILIGSKVGGIPDIIKDGKTGYLVQEKDPKAIAAAVIEINKRQEEWPAMKAKASEELGGFDWRRIAGRYAEILNAV